MADWINEKEKAYREQEAHAKRAGDMQLHRRKILDTKGRDLLDALTAQVQQDVTAYRQHVIGRPDREVDFNVRPSGGFSLTQSHFPAASVQCTLDLAAGVINVDYAFTRNHESDTHTVVEHVKIGCDANDNLILGASDQRSGSLADASRAIIERVLYHSR